MKRVRGMRRTSDREIPFQAVAYKEYPQRNDLAGEVGLGRCIIGVLAGGSDFIHRRTNEGMGTELL